MNMKCKKSNQEKPQPAAPAELTPEQIEEWEQTSGRLAAALELLEEFPVPYPLECLPVLIF